MGVIRRWLWPDDGCDEVARAWADSHEGWDSAMEGWADAAKAWAEVSRLRAEVDILTKEKQARENNA